jgi:hypothetical protein
MSTVQIQPGWHHGMSMTDYLAIEAMSASGIELIRRSPAHFRFAQQNPPKPTPAMIEGSALHTALLEPHLFEGRYIALGQCDGIKKDGQRCGYQASVYRGFSSYCGTHDPSKGEPMADGIEVITEDALERIGGMRDSILAHPEASRFFAGQGQSELVGVWLDEQSGVLCKIRLDRDIGRAAIHCDIKTTGTSAETDAFARQVGRLGYARKCAFYRRDGRARQAGDRLGADRGGGAEASLLPGVLARRGRHRRVPAGDRPTARRLSRVPGYRRLERLPDRAPAPEAHAVGRAEARRRVGRRSLRSGIRRP